eukprot:74393_1
MLQKTAYGTEIMERKINEHQCREGEKRTKISNMQCFFTTWKSSVGVGAYTVPYLFFKASPFIGFGVFTITVIVTCSTSLLMIDAHDNILSTVNPNKINKNTRRIKDDTVLLSYADTAGLTLGPLGYYLSFWSMVLGLMGSCTAYVIFLKQNLYTFIVQNHTEIELNQSWIPLCLFPLLVTTLFLRNMKRLSIINIVGILCLLIVVLILFIHSLQNDYTWSIINIKNTFFRLPTFNDLIISFGISSFCMEGLIFSCVPIYESMQHCNYDNYKRILISSQLCFVITYALFAVVSCLQYSAPNSVILLNFDNNSDLYCVLAYICCIQILCTYALVFYVVYILCEQSAFGLKYINNDVKQYAFRMFLILVIVVLATCVPQYAAFISFVGCVGNGATIFWIPSACYLMRYHKGFGIIWLNYVLCGKWKIARVDGVSCRTSESSSLHLYSIFREKQCDRAHQTGSVIGKYGAFTVIIGGVFCSVIGIYVSILQEI